MRADDRAELTRRTLLKVAGGTVVAGGAAALGVQYASGPAVAARGLGADDVSVTSADGELQELTIAPEVTVEWENYRDVRAVSLRFRADGPQSNGTVIDWTRRTLDSPQSSGEREFEFDTATMLSQNGGPLDASSFGAEEGETAENDVIVSMDLRLVDADENRVESRTPIAQTTYTVSVTGLESEVTVSGQLNTGAECVAVRGGLLEDIRCTVTGLV
jgi:hypothetical protein